MESLNLNLEDVSLFNSVKNAPIKQLARRTDTALGLIIAIQIIGLWAVSLVLLLSLNITQLPIWFIPIAIMWQMFLYTGLFITAHDAMHGAVFRPNKKINHAIGSVAVWLYCFFPYQQLLKKHWLHHHHPASDVDPDYHDGKLSNGILWYIHFMKNYWSWQQTIAMVIAVYVVIYIFHIPAVNYCLFGALPVILSSLQLFYFGTFLPHREPKAGYTSPHRAQTIHLSVFWSFIACYHFGYHQEHHEYPHVSWWQLPTVYQHKAHQF